MKSTENKQGSGSDKCPTMTVNVLPTRDADHRDHRGDLNTNFTPFELQPRHFALPVTWTHLEGTFSS